MLTGPSGDDAGAGTAVNYGAAVAAGYACTRATEDGAAGNHAIAVTLGGADANARNSA